MITVPQAYRDSMDKTGRNRSYVRVAVGIVNVDAQAAAKYSSNDSARITSFLGLERSEKVTSSYATFEKDRWTVDGTQLLAPSNSPYMFQGFVSGSISKEDRVFSVHPLFVATLGARFDIYGLTLSFDTQEKNYPVDFDVIGLQDSVEVVRHQIRENTSVVFERILPMNAVDEIRIEFISTNKPQQRVRLQQIVMGIGKTFSNNDLITTTLDASIHPISLELPTLDFSFTVDNTDGAYDLEYSDNIMFFLQSRQPVQVAYGYDIENDGNIHWISGGNYLLKARPEIGETSVVFDAGSSLLYLQNTFYKGLYRPAGITLYDLAEEVFTDAASMMPPGVQLLWSIDSTLQVVSTIMPLPIATHAECLQLIANAGRAVLSVDRNGRILMMTAFIPEATVSDNNHLAFSNSANLLNRTDTGLEYATFERNFWAVDGTRFLYSDTGPYQDTGYTSESQSDALGNLSPSPEITISLDGTFTLVGLTLNFGHVPPANFRFEAYSGSTLKQTWYISGNTLNTYALSETIASFDSLKIVFTKMSKPYTRLRIERILFGEETDYTLWRRNTAGAPHSTVLPLISTLGVNVYNMSQAAEATEIFKEDINLVGSRTLQITYSDAARDVVATITGDGVITCQQHYTYYSEITVTGSGVFNLVVMGKVLTPSSNRINSVLNPTGEPEYIENPLISSREVATSVLDWVSDYIRARKIHEVPYRGDPTLDIGDLIFYQTRSGSVPLTRITSMTLTAGQGISGNLTLKEVEEIG